MGGSSSSSNANPADSSINGNPQMVEEFANSTYGQAFTPAEIAGLNQVTYGQGGANYSNAGGGPGTDMNPVITAFNTWVSQQNAANTSQANYSTLANSEAGRDATILTGPAVNPNLNPSILGATNPLTAVGGR